MQDTVARSNLRDALSNLRQAIGDRDAMPLFLLIERNTIQVNRPAIIGSTWRFSAIWQRRIGGISPLISS